MFRFWKTKKQKIKQTKEVINRLQLRHDSFLRLLKENEHALDLMTELENKHYNGQLISIPYLKSMIKNLAQTIKNIIFDLETLSGEDYRHLLQSFENLEKTVRSFNTGSRDPIYTPTTIPMDRITTQYIDKVGSKMANLGELKNRCHLKIPDGFGLTACAYTHFSEYNNLPEKITGILEMAAKGGGHDYSGTERKIKHLIRDVRIPKEIAGMIQRESEKLEKKYNRPILWAVRSSAIGEDLENSFAGQFSSILNVPTERLLATYKEVVASKYNSRSMLYQKVKRIRPEDVNMSVGFIEMVDAQSSGVLYTTDPVKPEDGKILISAVWGLGQSLVEGSVCADTYLLERTPEFSLIQQEIVSKKTALKLKAQGGLLKETLDREKADAPCLTPAQLHRLGRAAMVIEEHFKCPQDVEWCFDRQDRLVILQARPLHLNTARQVSNQKIQAPVISDRAQPVAAGAGSGKVFKAVDIHHLFDMPKNAVLVLKHSSPQYIGALQRACAVVVEKGNLTDHMSSVVREFKVPCVVRVPDIFTKLENGREITVDATAGIIYDGIVPELLNTCVALKPVNVDIEQTESHHLLKNVAHLIFPLNLTDPRMPGFKETACRTWHDMIRFCHETALNEMFALKNKTRLDRIKNVHQVKTHLPLSLYVLNLFENTIDDPGRKMIDPEQIRCKPFQCLWTGMASFDRVSWQDSVEPAPVTGIFGAMIRTPAVENGSYDTRSFAVVTPEYMNLNLSMGYHYIVLDSHLSDDPYLNHITISFKGGAAHMYKRTLRLHLVAKILKQIGFTTGINQDFLKARIKSEDSETLKKCLSLVGKMLSMTRLLDMSLEDEKTVDDLAEKFFSLS